MKLRRTLLVSAVVVLLVVLALPAAASAAPLQTAGGSGCAQFHVVKYGETLNKIARHYGTTIWHLAALNGLANPDFIIAGQTLCVKAGGAPPGPKPPPPPPPPGPKPPPPPPHGGGFWYTVCRGDTLGNIGWRYGWGALTLAHVNSIPNPDRIYPGQRLWIPAH
jgi:LysM repeat protein